MKTINICPLILCLTFISSCQRNDKSIEKYFFYSSEMSSYSELLIHDNDLVFVFNDGGISEFNVSSNNEIEYFLNGNIFLKRISIDSIIYYFESDSSIAISIDYLLTEKNNNHKDEWIDFRYRQSVFEFRELELEEISLED